MYYYGNNWNYRLIYIDIFLVFCFIKWEKIQYRENKNREIFFANENNMLRPIECKSRWVCRSFNRANWFNWESEWLATRAFIIEAIQLKAARELRFRFGFLTCSACRAKRDLPFLRDLDLTPGQEPLRSNRNARRCIARACCPRLCSFTSVVLLSLLTLAFHNFIYVMDGKIFNMCVIKICFN